MLNSFFQSCSQSMFQPSFVNLQLMCIVDKSSRKIMDSRRMKMEDEFDVEIPAEELEDVATFEDVLNYLKSKGVEE